MTSLTDTLRLILSLPGRRPAASMPAVLDELFGRLAADKAPPDAQMIEDEIWIAWTRHPDPQAEAVMELAVSHIAKRAFPKAEALLDALVDAQPDWAEAWNKRATLYFLMGRHEESVADVHRTLELEPRHFGALCGFAQIALRHGHPAAARAAFDAALAAHPHLSGIREMRDQLGGQPSDTVH